MAYIIIIPILGLLMLFLLIITNLMGLKIIKASLSVHKRLSILLLLFAGAHGVFGWIYFNPSDPIGTIAGTVLFLLILLNILSGTGKIKLKIRVHRGIGYASILLGVLHAALGLLKGLGIVIF